MRISDWISYVCSSELIAEDLHHRLAYLRCLGDQRIELRFGEIVLQLEELGRRFGARKRLHRLGRLFKALARIFGRILTKRFGALRCGTPGGDHGFDIALGEVVEDRKSTRLNSSH